ncbi:hypothetical protein MNV49_005485 [Pseudohyphozyma bogoriensis]|nr:hypothetical protein MNV49_005485 [Pseudohyphozyma bogoriensis]
MVAAKKDVPTGIAKDGYVYYQAGGVPGRRLVRNPGDEGFVNTFDSVPIINFKDIYSPDLEVRKKIARKLGDAAENVGFFYAKNTPVTDEMVGRTFEAIKQFFALPAEEKERCAWTLTPGCRGYESFAEVRGGESVQTTTADLRESFLMGDCKTELEQWQGEIPAGMRGQNIWPEGMPEFRKAMLEYHQAILPFSRALLRLFALGLDLEETALDDLFEWPINALRPLHYPPMPPTEQSPGFLAHADFSGFTLVLQTLGYSSGLEVLNLNGHWIPAPGFPETTFTCNVGDYLAQISDGRYVSTVHRVLNHSGEERYSMPFFFSPDPDKTIVPFPAGDKRKAEAPAYVEQTVGDHYAKRLIHARPMHPMVQKIKELEIPENEWCYGMLTGERPIEF